MGVGIRTPASRIRHEVEAMPLQIRSNECLILTDTEYEYSK